MESIIMVQFKKILSSWQFIIPLLVVIIASLYLFRYDYGQTRFFKSPIYHHQTLRVFNDIPAGGGDTGEILEAIRHIRSGDEQSWFTGWNAAGERALGLAHTAKDRQSRGYALLRAHNYFRTAQFLLPPDDPKRPAAFIKDNAAFYAGLDALNVKYEVLRAPYAGTSLKAVYYPGPEGSAQRPLIVFCGGFDSTLEELYFRLVEAAYKHGYSVLTYDGPGQGSALREQHLTFTYEWEKPTSAVVNAFLKRHPKPPQMIIVGMSMGGYLAPRAAAFDTRFDGVVAFDVFYDIKEAVRETHFFNPSMMSGTWLDKMVIFIIAKFDPDFRWTIANIAWTIGAKDPISLTHVFDHYTLDGVAGRIKGHVLILAGEHDRFVPLAQVQRMQQALVSAKSITVKIYDQASGGAEHCQEGAIRLWQQDFFDWLSTKFPLSPV
jgi:pimeloyl-ACP methyl ester carboxylesterase